MKDQYFGDVNDYRKYGLLRALGHAGFKTLVVWMLTPNDGRSDGRFTDYLDQPSHWKHYDEELYDALHDWVKVSRPRRPAPAAAPPRAARIQPAASAQTPATAPASPAP